jgi:putative peptide zinc metalloprotease protein
MAGEPLIYENNQDAFHFSSTSRLQFNDLFEISDIDNNIYLYNKQTEKLFRIPAHAKLILSKIRESNVTFDELFRELEESFDLKNPDVTNQLTAFLNQMLNVGVIFTHTNKHEEEQSTTGTMWKDKIDGRILKFNLISTLDEDLQGFKLKLPAWSKKTWTITISIYTLSLCLFIYIFMLDNPGLFYGSRNYFLIIPWLIVHLTGHELLHALMCKHVGGKVKEAGVGLLYYFIPVAYVKTAETFKLSSGKRAAIAVVGPVYDITMALITLVITVLSEGTFFHYIAFHIMVFQFSLFIFNCNPLLPTDLFRTIESLSGQINVRGRSLKFLKGMVFKKTLPLYLRNISVKMKLFYFTYSILSVLYLSLLIYLTLNLIIKAIN